MIPTSNWTVKTDLIDFEPALHVQGLLLNLWVHHAVMQSLAKLSREALAKHSKVDIEANSSHF